MYGVEKNSIIVLLLHLQKWKDLDSKRALELKVLEYMYQAHEDEPNKLGQRQASVQ